MPLADMATWGRTCRCVWYTEKLRSGTEIVYVGCRHAVQDKRSKNDGREARKAKKGSGLMVTGKGGVCALIIV